MFKLLTNVPSNANIGKFDLSPNLKNGDVIQLTVKDNSVCLVKSNGVSPFGILLKKVRVVDKKTKTVKRSIGKVAFSRCLIETDNYDVSQRYPINANLFINQHGQFTTFRLTENHQAIGIVTNCPTANNSSIQLLWF